MIMLNIPNEAKCLEIICEESMLAHIIEHSKQVSQVALYLADLFIAADFKLNRQLVFAAALLHDITKTRSLITGENHAQSGAEMLSALGYPEVGNIVGQHVKLDHFDLNAPPNEAEVVNYADKRVLHEKVVGLKERMAYIMERYAVTEAHRQRLYGIWQETLQLEKKLFSHLPITADELIANLPKTPVSES